MIEGHHNIGPFNRSAAVNTAARLAGDWDTALIVDGDVLASPALIREAVAEAEAGTHMVLPFDIRLDISLIGTNHIVQRGYQGDWHRYVRKQYTEMCSGIVAVSRSLWDTIGGFDEAFQGWGFEDNAFACCAQTFGGQPLTRLKGEMWHLFHRTASVGARGTPEWSANQARAEQYRVVLGDKERTRALQAEGKRPAVASLTIPRILHRVVPESTTAQAEAWWTQFQALHPDWQFLTHRDPLNPLEWPMTAPYWNLCTAGAQLADLVRLEALWRWGGVYVDQDVEPYRSFEPLLGVQAFAGWEDKNTVPNAVMGARAEHPAILECLQLCIARTVMNAEAADIWAAGPGVTTQVLPGRTDVLLLPPGSFYPYHYKEKHRASDDHQHQQPWAFCAHHWWGSWIK